MRKLAIDPLMRGLGLGSRLVNIGIKVLRTHDYKVLWCDARTNALGFYQKLGFKTDNVVFEKSGVLYQKATFSIEARPNEGNPLLISEFVPENALDDNGIDLVIADVDYLGTGMIGISRLPGIFGQLNADLGRIADWHADVVVSMNTDAELKQAKCNELGSELKKIGIEWIRLPVSDYGGLDQSRVREWQVISDSLHEVLKKGGRVLTHCWGGHGRSGMVTMRLLVEGGDLPDAAQEKIRSARPGAIETREQFLWAAMPELLR